MATVPSSKFPFMAGGDPTAPTWVGHSRGRAEHARVGGGEEFGFLNITVFFGEIIITFKSLSLGSKI